MTMEPVEEDIGPLGWHEPPVVPPKKHHRVRNWVLTLSALVIMGGVGVEGWVNGGAASNSYSAAATTIPVTTNTTVNPVIEYANQMSTIPATTIPATTVTLSASDQALIAQTKCEGVITSWTVWISASPDSEATWQALAPNLNVSEWVEESSASVLDQLDQGQSYSQVASEEGPAIYQGCLTINSEGAPSWPKTAFAYGMAPILVISNGQAEPNPNPTNADTLYLEIMDAEGSS